MQLFGNIVELPVVLVCLVSHPVLISFTWNSKNPHLEGTLIFLSPPQRATAWPMTLKC